MKNENKKRRVLTRDRILESALVIIDQLGLDALTMRSLAEALGVEAMSLYNHVANKNAILTGVMDLVLGAVELPDAQSGTWRKWVDAWMQRTWMALASHPRLLGVLSEGQVQGEQFPRLLASLAARLADAGLDAQAQNRVWAILKAYLLGSLMLDTLTLSQAATADSGAKKSQDTFIFGLDLLLSGLEKEIDRLHKGGSSRLAPPPDLLPFFEGFEPDPAAAAPAKVRRRK